MNDQTTFYISTGAQTKMYTLRVQWREDGIIEGERITIDRDQYVRNLSTDANKAKEVAESMGYTVELPKFDLEEIRRRDSEEVARYRREKEEAAEILRVAAEERLIALLKAGLFPFGQFKGEPFESASLSYIMYWLKLTNLEDSVGKSLVNTLRGIYKDLVAVIEMKPNGEYFGQPKTRYKKLSGYVVDKFGFEGNFGWTNVVNIILESGELLNYIGAGYLEDTEGTTIQVADKITFDGTVKEHTVYNEDNQTKVQRIKVQKIERMRD